MLQVGEDRAKKHQNPGTPRVIRFQPEEHCVFHKGF